MKREIEIWLLRDIYSCIGIDEPINHAEIVDFIKSDVEETANFKDYHTGDFAIAFRRYLEKDIEI